MTKQLEDGHDCVRDDEDGVGMVELLSVPTDPLLVKTQPCLRRSCLKIQKCFRRRKAVELARIEVRNNFNAAYGQVLKMRDVREILQTDFLRQLIFFFKGSDEDIEIVSQVCNAIAEYEKSGGDIYSIIDGTDDCIIYQLKRFTIISLESAHKKWVNWCGEILMSAESTNILFVQLLESVICLLKSDSPFVCHIIGYLQEQKVYLLFRQIILAALEKNISFNPREKYVLEKLLTTVASHCGNQLCCCPLLDLQHGFMFNILSINGIWKILSGLWKVFSTDGFGKFYINQMAVNVPCMKGSIPSISPIFPGPACILANLLELDDLLRHSTNVSDLICIYTSLLDDFPSMKCGSDGLHIDVVDSLHDSLCKRITAAFTSESPLVEILVNTRTRDINFSYPSEQLQDVSSAMKQIGCFINILLDTFGNGPISVLACHTDFILEIFKFLDLLEKSNQASSSDLLADARLELIILLPIFSLIFKNILETIDRKCFYELHKPFSFDELQKVVVLLKKVLWNLLCDSPLVDGTSSNGILGFRKLSLEKLKTNARQSIGELLVELQDWNIFEKFTSATNFCCDEISEDFVTKALEPGSLECQILQCAPFLIPFDIRSAILQRHLFGSKSTSNSFLKIRRNHILEDSLQLSLLTEEELRGKIWVTFITEDGESEQGVDLGGLFREFLDDASFAAFNPDNKMMKETKKAQLYPNPNSGLYKEDHLKVFHFLGTLLGKAIFGRVPLNLPPFAPFFIRKFMQKSIHINHLKSLDEDLYESLHTIKALGNVSDACLSFCTESGGRVEEFLYGGKEIEVSNRNVNSYVNLHCSHFLNYLIEQQSVHFTKGLLSVIKKEWIDMFNEMEFQLIISGIQVDTGLDIDDMYNNTTYHQYVQSDTTIRIFWEVLKELNPATQKKFLKFFSAQSCVPYNGFRDLDPKFNIKRLDIGDTANVQRLPTVSTCYNTLHLPPYDSKEVLKTKLLQTMEESSSFSMA